MAALSSKSKSDSSRRRLVWQLFPKFVLILFFVMSTSIISVQMLSGLSLILIIFSIASLGLYLFYFVVNRTILPLEDLADSADRLLKGGLDVRLPSAAYDVGVDLFDRFGEIARGLESRMRTIVQQSSEQEAVLACLIEGVVALDLNGKILRMNEAAGKLLGFDSSQADRRSLEEVFRNIELQRFVREAIETCIPAETSVIFPFEQERNVDVYSRVLVDARGIKFGVVIVLHDVTRLRHLERVRRDFIANVSHELKTPVTSIKGFVETLLDGAMSDPKDAERFLGIIARQAERLHSIFEDLLSLARLEESPEKEKSSIEKEEFTFRDVLESALQSCELKIKEKDIRIELDCDPSLTSNMNPSLIEQAVINLINNAITYSEPGSIVKVSASRDGSISTIRVQDHGCGIEKSQLSRIFERFYRVDSGRSRKQGGTGLGLSIVKHIAQAHDGDVKVESLPGKGSTFSFTIRAPQQ